MYAKAMPLERKLHQDIMTQFPSTVTIPDMYGVEVELEGKQVKSGSPYIAQYWHQHPDNSLRVHMPGDEAIEYVMSHPLDLKGTQAAIKALFDHLNSPGVQVYESYRTSIHVHLSCMCETQRTIYNFMTLAVIFDELLTSQNGDHRIGNNFCLRSRDAQGQIEEIVKSIMHQGNFFSLNGNNRYSSINFVSLLKYGTIEFRSLECTTDTKRLLHWVDTLSRLRQMARSYVDPQMIIRSFSQLSGEEFLYHVLGPCADKYVKVDGWERLLQQGMRLAQDLAYCSQWLSKDKNQLKAEDEDVPLKPKKKTKGAFFDIEGFGDGAGPWGHPPAAPALHHNINHIAQANNAAWPENFFAHQQAEFDE